MRRLSLLGSTGSIGRQTLEVAAAHPERIAIAGLAAGGNLELLIQQTKQFQPALVSVTRRDDAARVREAVSNLGVEVVSGPEGLRAVAEAEADLVIEGIAELPGAIHKLESP